MQNGKKCINEWEVLLPRIIFVVTRGESSPVNEEKRFIATPSGGGHFECSDLSINIPLWRGWIQSVFLWRRGRTYFE